MRSSGPEITERFYMVKPSAWELSPHALISIKRAGLSPGQRDAVIDLLQRFDLPTRLPKNFPREKIFKAAEVR